MDSNVLGQLIGAGAAVLVALIGLIGVILNIVLPRRLDNDRAARPRRSRIWSPRTWKRRTAIIWVLVLTTALGATGGLSLVNTLTRLCQEPIQLRLLVSIEKDRLLGELADRYNRAERQCADVSVADKSSGAALKALIDGDWSAGDGRRPDVWLPSASLWPDLLRNNPKAKDRPAGEWPSIAHSPLVIAVPAKVAAVLGWNSREIGWHELLEFARNPVAWDEYRQGRADLPRNFVLAKENPINSTSAFAATVSSYLAMAAKHNGASAELTVADVRDRRISNDVRNVESSLQYLTDSVMDLLKNFGDEDALNRASSYLSGLVIQEELVYLYNSGDPEIFERSAGPGRAEPLRVFYPNDGTIMMDHPHVMLPGLDPAKREVAEDFLEFLLAPEQQRSSHEKGFRDHEGGMSDEKVAALAGLPAKRPSAFLPVPAAATLQAIYDQADSLRRRVDAYVIVDRSGSMGESEGRFQSGLEIVKDLLRDKMPDQLGDEDRLSVASFADSYHLDVPATSGRQLKNDQDWFNRRIENITAGGTTGLYAAVLTTTRKLTRESSRSDDRVPAIILLSDGYDTQKKLSLKKFLEQLKAEGRETAVPRIYTIAFGVIDENRDRAANALQEISDATRGVAFNSKKDPVDLDHVFDEILGHL
ncbi:VWA domain-containing protein [Acrocarpospora corrugata]|uniref:VWA domain-containing protein n=1 Tax=Acrocarpospora corrugata TaxID=35763 RepID=A0A5M3VUB5_9ACTN|nr:VWA domain-containing protein [Acrocarpospora corrugata]GER98320.1 VWA domain-containing protein [Acrocarpospora corrugata]